MDAQALTALITPVINGLNQIGMNFFGEDPLAAGFGLFNAGGILFMIVGIGFSKPLADKYGKRDVFGTALFISTLFILVFYLFRPQSVVYMFGAQILHGFFYGITIPLLWAMIADVADFSEWKNGRRATAIIFSAMMVGLKAGLSIGSAMIAAILGLYHYIPGEALAQPEQAISGIRLLVSVYASIPFLLCIVLLFFYEINKPLETTIEADLLQRRNPVS